MLFRQDAFRKSLYEVNAMGCSAIAASVLLRKTYAESRSRQIPRRNSGTWRRRAPGVTFTARVKATSTRFPRKICARRIADGQARNASPHRLSYSVLTGTNRIEITQMRRNQRTSIVPMHEACQ
jgi:hypothetical protein